MSEKKGLLFKILSGFSFLVGVLLLITALESYMRGEVHFLLVFLSLINGICGILGGLLLLFRLEQGRILLKWQFLTGMLFVIFYAVVNNEWRNPTILLTILFISLFIVSRLKVIKRSVKNIKREGERILKINWKSKLLLLLIILMLVLTWSFKWEEYLNIFNEPNGEGLSFYLSQEKSPMVQVFVEGGYIYDYVQKKSSNLILNQVENLDPIDGIDGELIIVMNEPNCSVNIEAYSNETIRVRIINSMDKSQFKLDGKEVVFNRSMVYEKWFDNSLKEKDWISSVQSSLDTLADKGYWKDILVSEGESYKIDIYKKDETEKQSNWKFYVLSDQHSGYKTYLPILKDILNDNSEFVVWNGDIVNWGFPTEYMIASSIAQSYPISVYTTVGNHDAWNDGSMLYNKYFGSDYYSFEYREDKFIFLDTSQGVLGSSQLDWLENELEGWEEDKIFIFSHMSPIDTVIGKYDTSDLIDPELSRTMHSKAESDYLVDLMEEYKVDVLFSGHSHVMGRSLLNGTWYISSGALGGTVEGDHNVGYLACEISQEDFECEEIIVKSNEQVTESRLENYINAMNVFGIPFLINKSIRISITILLFILFELVWFSQVDVYEERRKVA
jgi:predicted phosphodiesterase